MNPLSKVMGGWGIWETVNGEQKLTTECIENVIMMVPFSAVVIYTYNAYSTLIELAALIITHRYENAPGARPPVLNCKRKMNKI